MDFIIFIQSEKLLYDYLSNFRACSRMRITSLYHPYSTRNWRTNLHRNGFRHVAHQLSGRQPNIHPVSPRTGNSKTRPHPARSSASCRLANVLIQSRMYCPLPRIRRRRIYSPRAEALFILSSRASSRSPGTITIADSAARRENGAPRVSARMSVCVHARAGRQKSSPFDGRASKRGICEGCSAQLQCLAAAATGSLLGRPLPR